MVQIDEWKAELKKTPTQYANDRKAQYQEKVRARLHEWKSSITQLEPARLTQKSKIRRVARTLEEKIEEVHEHLGKLESAAVGAWEELKHRIDHTSAYIGKHVNRLISISEKKNSNS